MSAVKLAADAYISRGWQVVPLHGKACKDKDWQNLIFATTDFRDTDNIGIRSVEGMVDVDLDSPESVIVADTFLPKTGSVYGRASKPRSHHLYICPAIKTALKFEDLVEKSCIVEVRVNHQSMAPPSLHPSGEYVEWSGTCEEPTKQEPETITRAVQLLATAAMTAKYYNPAGSRHDWGLALAGVFRQYGLKEDEAETILRVAGEHARDSKVSDRILAVHSTYAKPEMEPIAGTKALETAMGPAGPSFTATLRKIWNVEASGISISLMDALNSKHAIIFQQSGDLVIITEDKDTDNRPFLRYSSPATLRELYPQPIVIGYGAGNRPITKPLGKAWLESPKRRFYNGIELAPNGKSTPGYYNIWRGFSVEAKQGSWTRYREHLFKIVCNENRETALYVYNWMANALQNPGHQGETAIAVRGAQGTGKGFFVREFGSLFGVHFLHLDSTRHLTGNFNAHLHNAILVFADEAAWPGDKAGLGALKRMITEPTLSIERKGMDIFSVPNVIHMILASNEERVVPANIGERRFVVLDINDSKANDHAYFEEIRKEMQDEGGREAMLYDLLNHKIDVNLRQIPATDALFEQKRLSMTPEHRWWYQVLQSHQEWWEGENKFECDIDRSLVYDDYTETLHKAGRSQISISTELGMLLKKLLPDPYPKNSRKMGKVVWTFPSLAECRKQFEKQYRVTAEAKWDTSLDFVDDDSKKPDLSMF